MSFPTKILLFPLPHLAFSTFARDYKLEDLIVPPEDFKAFSTTEEAARAPASLTPGPDANARATLGDELADDKVEGRLPECYDRVISCKAQTADSYRLK